jgi:hypothetical protein
MLSYKRLTAASTSFSVTLCCRLREGRMKYKRRRDPSEHVLQLARLRTTTELDVYE